MVAGLWLCKKGMLGGMICLFEIVICIRRCSLKVCGEEFQVWGHGMDFAGWFGEWAWAEGGFVVK